MTVEDLNDTVSFDAIDQLAKENKGEFGEALAGIWLKDRLKKNPSLIAEQEISDPDPRMWFSHLGRHRCTYGKVDDFGVEEISWEPDYSFTFTLPDHGVRKEVLVEAKTGNSDLMRHQSEVMELVAQEEDTVVFLCRITLNDAQAEITYTQITADD